MIFKKRDDSSGDFNDLADSEEEDEKQDMEEMLESEY